MKVSIITMTTTYNYGATLQAYALQEFVKKLGCKCDIIDHMSAPEKHRKIKLTDFSRENIKKMPYKFMLERGYRRFEDFYDQHMNMTERYAHIEDLYTNPPQSDIFISGSDQVWNYKDAKLDRFLLDFVPNEKTKISYAASMGNPTLPEDKKERYIKSLSRFNAISVREQEACNMIQPLTDQKVNVHCDPAFLLNVDEWRTLENPVVGLNKDEYILCYLLHTPSWFNKWIYNLRKKTSKKIVFIGLNGYRPINCDVFVRDAGPKEFLWLIDNAAMVVSSSFHGNVFSIIFGKILVSMPDIKRPDRIRNLLRMFGEENREVYDIDDNYNSLSIDCVKVDNVVKEEQQRSRIYLQSIFQTQSK